MWVCVSLCVGLIVSNNKYYSIELWSEKDFVVVSEAVVLRVVTLTCIMISLAFHTHDMSFMTLTTESVPSKDCKIVLGFEHEIFSISKTFGPPLGLSWPSSFGKFGDVKVKGG